MTNHIKQMFAKYGNGNSERFYLNASVIYLTRTVLMKSLGCFISGIFTNHKIFQTFGCLTMNSMSISLCKNYIITNPWGRKDGENTFICIYRCIFRYSNISFFTFINIAKEILYRVVPTLPCHMNLILRNYVEYICGYRILKCCVGEM